MIKETNDTIIQRAFADHVVPAHPKQSMKVFNFLKESDLQKVKVRDSFNLQMAEWILNSDLHDVWKVNGTGTHITNTLLLNLINADHNYVFVSNLSWMSFEMKL